jgi:hypothetical protein
MPIGPRTLRDVGALEHARMHVPVEMTGCRLGGRFAQRKATAPWVLLTQVRLHFGQRPRPYSRRFIGRSRGLCSCPNRFNG